ncbi:hypothetical protein NMY22_g502 [Coprinellus aureogranulatus]|nr:hypothetical protein NMY22_g502 [Coprinellus aureogranulatus]
MAPLTDISYLPVPPMEFLTFDRIDDTVQAAVLYPGAGRELHVEEQVLYPLEPHQVEIAVAVTGLCGSDLHYYQDGRNGAFNVKGPLVLGHEAAGVITAVGRDVDPGLRLSKGQRVAIEAGIYCRECSFCRKGRYNLCKAMKFCSSASAWPHMDGTLRERMNHPAFLVHRLPDTCTFEQASLAEPLSVLIHASRRADLKAGQSVLVFGAGTIGLLACALAKARGASRVVVVDVNSSRLEFARRNGFATETYTSPQTASSHPPPPSTCCSSCSQAIPANPPPSPRQISEAAIRQSQADAGNILEHFGLKGTGFDLVYECTGAEPCIQMSVFAASTGGKVMLIGMGSQNPCIPISSAACREVDILGSFRYCNTYPEALDLLASGKLDVDCLVTHRYPLKDAKKAFEVMGRGVDDKGIMVMKVMVGPGHVSV